MKTEALKALGLTDEQVAAVMKENGIDIAAEQKKASKIEAERDNYKSQLDTAQEALKGFDGVDVGELKGKIETLTADLVKKDGEYQSKIADMEFNSKLDGLITRSGAKNSKAVRALLDLDALKTSKNQDTDLQAALVAVQKENDYLFGSAESSTPGITTGTPAAGGGGVLSNDDLSKLDYAAYKAYRSGEQNGGK